MFVWAVGRMGKKTEKQRYTVFTIALLVKTVPTGYLVHYNYFKIVLTVSDQSLFITYIV